MSPSVPVSRETPVVILCGGRGSRRQEPSGAIPTPMVEIGGSPILWHGIQDLLELRLWAVRPPDRGFFGFRAGGFDRLGPDSVLEREALTRLAAEAEWHGYRHEVEMNR